MDQRQEITSFEINSIGDIEIVLCALEKIERNIIYYQDLKKHRTSSIDAKIDELSSKSQQLRDNIFGAMKKIEPTRKSLDFPDIGRVTRRKVPASWEVNDEVSLLDYLKKEGVKDKVVKVVEKVVMKDLKKELDYLSGLGKNIIGAVERKKTESLSVSFAEKDVLKVEQVIEREITEPARVLNLEELEL